MMGRKGEIPEDAYTGGAGDYVHSVASRNEGQLEATERKRQQRRWGEKPARADNPEDRTRHTYHVGDHLHWRLMQLAEKHEVPISDMAHWILQRGIELVECGEWDPQPESVTIQRRLR